MADALLWWRRSPHNSNAVRWQSWVACVLVPSNESFLNSPVVFIILFYWSRVDLQCCFKRFESWRSKVRPQGQGDLTHKKGSGIHVQWRHSWWPAGAVPRTACLAARVPEAVSLASSPVLQPWLWFPQPGSPLLLLLGEAGSSGLTSIPRATL